MHSQSNSTWALARLTGAIIASLPLISPAIFAQGLSLPPSPADLVQQTVTRELAAANAGGHYMYRLRKETGRRGSETRDIIETQDWLIGRIVLRDGHPLSSEQRQEEDERLQRLIRNRRDLEEFQRDQHHDESRVRNMMRALPDAFLYKYEGTPQNDSRRALVRLAFRPNPNFKPSSRELQVLQGMEGTMLIDSDVERLVRVDAKLVRDVDFGWGILGRLYRGGSFLLQQHEVGSGRWAITELALHFTGKVLLFKTININSVSTASDFRRMPDNLTLQQGLELLLEPDRMTAPEKELRTRQ